MQVDSGTCKDKEILKTHQALGKGLESNDPILTFKLQILVCVHLIFLLLVF